MSVTVMDDVNDNKLSYNMPLSLLLEHAENDNKLSYIMLLEHADNKLSYKTIK
jgi:hypothetical protein